MMKRTPMKFQSDRCLVIGEVAQAHDGSLGMAHAYIDAIARTGADAVKFQTHIADAESTPAEPWRTKFSRQDATRSDYWRRMEFSEKHWRGLADHASDRDLLFLSSPFSLEAFDLLSRIGVSAWKVASGEITNGPLLKKMADSGLPLLLSTGMSPLDEVDAVVRRLRRRNRSLAVLQCTTAYPCPPEKIGLNLLSVFRNRYRLPVGLSDHSGTIYPSLAAAVLGASVVEVHVTLSRDMFGPDVTASVTTEELATLVRGIRFVEAMRSHPVDKSRPGTDTRTLRRLFMKSLVARRALPAGHRITPADVTLKKPGTGLPADRMGRVIGRRLKRAMAKDEVFREKNLEVSPS